MKKIIGIFIFGLSMLGAAHAGTMQGAVSVESNTEWSSTYSATNLIDQNGLSSSYTSGVTDFDSYVATHSIGASKEWFAAKGTFTDTLVFDLGGLFIVDKIAVWNEEAWGTDSVTISASKDALFSSSTLLGTFLLTDNVSGINYLADILGSFSPVLAQFFKFDVVGSTGNSVALGEVAFSTIENVSQVPVPAAIWFMGSGLLGLAGFSRKAKKLAA